MLEGIHNIWSSAELRNDEFLWEIQVYNFTRFNWYNSKSQLLCVQLHKKAEHNNSISVPKLISIWMVTLMWQFDFLSWGYYWWVFLRKTSKLLLRTDSGTERWLMIFMGWDTGHAYKYDEVPTRWCDMPYSTRNIEFISYNVWKEDYVTDWVREIATGIMRLDARALFLEELGEEQSLRKQSLNHSTIQSRNYKNHSWHNSRNVQGRKGKFQQNNCTLPEIE